MKFFETIFTKFSMSIKLGFSMFLILLIACDIVALMKTGKLVVEPAVYALLLVAICIEEVVDARDKVIQEIKSIKDSKTTRSTKSSDSEPVKTVKPPKTTRAKTTKPEAK